ncbi:zinc-ribbon domain-containing protein [Leifsonia sp. C5G2]|uniref:zinc-ribbon domain-containing protein n=1 Tax=Leifsonia sp. C5G2 TaxID=2735269 RepID=UPI0015852124|nr:zinc-ribbon domain-containing protein [Leifsonia sp. C5G2]NUU06187.1 zinc-ribbon domain-containing protein [Leifsonia sp. C5G2]
MNTIRRYRVSPRPFHRETLFSYTSRCLAANFETELHRQQMISDFSTAKSRVEREQAWRSILSVRVGRSLSLDADPSGWVRHVDGSACEACDKDLPSRTACTLCSQGATISQNPHFDDLVCIRHHRWVGLTTPAAEQRQVGVEHVDAALQFAKLKRAGRLDLRLFTLVTRNLRERSIADEALTFPNAIAVIRAITAPSFTRRFFSPTKPFNDSFEHLAETLTAITSGAEDRLARALWLYARATFCDIRQAIICHRPFKATWSHDYPVHPSVVRNLTTYTGTLQPFADYLKVTGDTPQTTVAAVDHQRIIEPEIRLSVRDQEIASVCSNGHLMRYTYATERKGTNGKMPTCQICRGWIVIAGVNDIATTDPEIAAELDPHLNGGLTAQHISANSKQTYIWRCPAKNHPYPATASNRTKANSKCPVCLNRLIVAGINDLATTHPEVAAEFHPSELSRTSPTNLSSNSEMLIDFLCANEHTYRARIYDRVRAAGCPECVRNANAASKKNLVATHPAVAAEWHPSANGDLRPEHFTHGSNEEVFWLCPKGHDYEQRIDRRAAGYQCSVCSRRRLVIGTNDVATEHPKLVTEWHQYLNYPKKPNEIFPGTEKYYWKCKAAGHKTHQSIPHRLKSKGCTECRPEARILR